jgi:23S rRNA (uracil1939-C5)-methyltransferase
MSRTTRAAAPIEEGVVSGLTHEGEGIVKSGIACFVPGALPGERVQFRRTGRRKQHDEGQLDAVLERSPDRVKPRCEHFGVCGGCALQHLSSDAQRDVKQRELAENLFRIGGVTPTRWLEPLRGPEWEYRRRARLSARFVTKKGRSLVGFRERGAPYVADVKQCHVLAPPVGRLIELLGALLTSLDGRETIPQIEVAVSDIDTALVFRTLESLSEADLARLLAFESEHAVRVYLQPGGPATAVPMRTPPAQLSYALPHFDLVLDFLPTDFVQINGAINTRLTELAVRLLELSPSSSVLDLFCGLGNFTLPIARHAARAVGVEGDSELVARARANAGRNSVTNATFHTADLSVTPDSQLPWLKGNYSHVLLDPPRVGAREVLAAVAAVRPQRIVYISCHTGSLARDLGELCGTHGFELRAAGILDMFPHTNHVESIAVLDA